MDIFTTPAQMAKLNDVSVTYGHRSSYTNQSPLTELVDLVARQVPDKVAIKYKTQSITYQELELRSNQVARLLYNKGIRPGDAVGIAVDRSADMVVMLMAIMKSGCCYIPIDPAYPFERINFMLGDSSAKILITSLEYSRQFNNDIEELLLEDILSQIPDIANNAPDVEVKGDSPAYILYTSGSTGLPKGVEIEHHSLVNFLISMQKFPGIDRSDKLLAITTISFDIAGLELYLPLLAGAQLIVADADSARDGRELLSLIRSEQVTIMQATPYTWRMMLLSGWDRRIPIKVLCGGEALQVDLAHNLLSKCKALYNMYGPTETTIWSTVKKITAADNIITVGRPIDNTQVYIMDENLNELPAREIGEIIIAGDGVARRYLNRPELTEEKFISDPFSNIAGAKMYRTGDLGKITPDGEIHCLGRIDQQIKVNGFRIEAGEIEHALIKQPGIKSAAVIAIDDSAGNKILAAYIIPGDRNDNSKLKIDNWRAVLGETLPRHMIPHSFNIIAEMPLTPNGKVDRKALPLQPRLNADDNEVFAARTATEKTIAAIWRKYLHYDDISIRDSFFDLGGHSFISVQVMRDIEKQTGVNLRLSSLFENPTIEQFSAFIDSGGRSNDWDSLVPIKPSGNKPPIYIIHGDGLHVMAFNSLAAHMDTGQPVFGLEPKGLNGIDEPTDNIPGIAKDYIEAIMRQNPSGPYILAGYSFGGYVAVEMLKQLTEMGKEVSKLILFDTSAEKDDIKPWHFMLPRKLKNNLPKFLSFSKAMQLLRPIFGASALKKENYALYQRIENIRKIQGIALGNYKIEAFDARVHLFKAKNCVHYVYDTEYYGWSKYAKKGVEVQFVPGDHLSMLELPNAEEFAIKLQAVLNLV